MLRGTSVIVVIVVSVAMNENGGDTPEQVLKFVPKERPRSYGFPVEETGQTIVAKIQKAADLSNENCDRAMKLAHTFDAAQSRRRSNKSIRGRGRTLPRPRGRSERWLQTIQKGR